VDEDGPIEVALHRYAVIAPLVEGAVPPGGQAKTLRQLAAAHDVAPRTRLRWLARFRSGGLQGLRPPTRRQDAGSLKAFDRKWLDEAVRLREEEPRRSTATIIALLERLDPDCA